MANLDDQPALFDFDLSTMDAPVPDQLAGMQDHLDSLRAANKETFRQVTAPLPDGRRPMPDPNSVLAMRLNCLLDILLQNPLDRLAFEIAFEQQMQAALAEMLSERRRADLLAPPTSGVSSLFVPGKP